MKQKNIAVVRGLIWNFVSKTGYVASKYMMICE